MDAIRQAPADALTQPYWAPMAETSLDTIEPALAQAILAALFSRMVPVSAP